MRNKKINKWRAPIKNQNGDGLNSKILIATLTRATVPELAPLPKI
jgi:hypothetical protein